MILEESYIFVGYALETVLKMFCGSGVEKRCAQTHELELC